MKLRSSLQALRDSVAASRQRRIFFILGVPGSGCTRVAHVLTMHPAIYCTLNGHFSDSLERRMREALAHYNAEIPRHGNWSRHRKEGTDLVRPELFTYKRDEMDLLTADAVHLVLSRAVAGKEPVLVGDYTPDNIKHFSSLARLFSDASFLHVVRDVRDVVVSACLQHERTSTRSVTTTPVIGKDPESIARYWFREITKARAIAGQIGERYMEVHYEQLWNDPEGTFGKVLQFLVADAVSSDAPGVDHVMFLRSDEPLTDRANIPGVWKDHLSLLQQEQITASCGKLLTRLGYK